MSEKSSKSGAKQGNKPAGSEHAAAGQAAFEALEAKLLAIPKAALIPVNVDVQIAATTAAGVARAIGQDRSLRARFAALASVKEFELAKLDGLVDVAHAAWYARHMQLLASATESEAQLPASLVTTATALKARMMRVVEYHLGDHELAGPLVSAIRSGSGHQDLANDLIALARLYADYKGLLAHDKKDYQAADQKLAAATGDKIVELLGGGATQAQRTWTDRQARAWTRLDADYGEVRAAGRFLKRKEDDMEATFPSLVAASRAAVKAAPAAPAGEPPAAKS